MYGRPFAEKLKSKHLGEVFGMLLSLELQKYVVFMRDYAKKLHCVILQLSLHKKQSFPLRISSVNLTKSPVFCEFGHIY